MAGGKKNMKDYTFSPNKGLNYSIQRRYLGIGNMDDVLLSFILYFHNEYVSLLSSEKNEALFHLKGWWWKETKNTSKI